MNDGIRFFKALWQLVYGLGFVLAILACLAVACFLLIGGMYAIFIFFQWTITAIALLLLWSALYQYFRHWGDHYPHRRESAMKQFIVGASLATWGGYIFYVNGIGPIPSVVRAIAQSKSHSTVIIPLPYRSR